MHYSLKSELLGVNTKMGFLHCEEKLFYKQNMCTKLLKLHISSGYYYWKCMQNKFIIIIIIIFFPVDQFSILWKNNWSRSI